MLSKVNIFNKISFLNITIIILGYFVVFGLGFALGLYYSQNTYLIYENEAKDKLLNNKLDVQKSKKNGDFIFFSELKKSLPQNAKSNFFYNPSTKFSDEIKLEKNLNALKNKDPNVIEKPFFETPNDLTIQIYSFKSQEIAENIINDLIKKGYPAYESKIELGNNEIYYRVRIGHFKNRMDANRLLNKILKSENSQAFITRN